MSVPCAALFASFLVTPLAYAFLLFLALILVP